MKKLSLITFLFLSFIGHAQLKKPKNVILLIGDGMGLSQVSTAFYFGDKEPNFSRFNTIGLINTSSAKQRITDSAAGATAFACGIKSYNGAISVDTLEQPAKTIVEIAERKGVNTGLIATSSITHATPACFYAHVASRSMHEEIALALSPSGVDFFAGGGYQFFTEREDKKDLLKDLNKAGYEIFHDQWNPELKMDLAKKYGFFLADNGLPSKLDGRGDFLTEATEMGLKYLSQKEGGFFLMVEGSQIDWEGHAANSDGIIQEVLDFDKAIGVALDFAQKNGETLVIVTADHETGGYALAPGNKNKEWQYNDIEPTFYEGATDLEYAAHTATLIPVFAYGPQAQTFAGIYQNSDVFHKIMRATGWNLEKIQKQSSGQPINY